jgi:subtilisin-like proprotein convertase family protein
MLVRTAAFLIVAVLALPVAEVTQPAAASKRFKNVDKTFSNTGQISIPGNGEATPYPAPIQVSGFKNGKIKDVNLTLRNFSHTFPDHVDVLLVSPDGRNALVMSDVGGTDNADNLTITLDDDAISGLPLSSQLTSGSFKPTNDGAIDNLPAPAPLSSGNIALNAFNGANPNGHWQLFVRDDNPGDNGNIAGGWSLQVTAKVKKKHQRRHHRH